MNQRSFTSRTLAIFLVLLLAALEPAYLLAATPKTAPRLPDPGSVGISKEEQAQVGVKAVQEVYKQMPVLPDSHPVTQYVQTLAKRLTGVIPPEDSWPFQFHVVQQKEINAFALPGGPIFINLGTITAASNEAELAGVVAHEIAHVYMQHSAKAASKQGLLQGLAGVLGGVLGGAIGGTAGALAQAGMSIGAGIVSMKYSRSDEAEADTVGAIIMYKAGYNPVSMANFFEKLERESGGSSGPQFLSDHPNPGNRVAAVNREIQNWPPARWQQNSAQFTRAKQTAANTKAYSAQEIAQMAKTGGIPNQQGGAATGGGTMSPVSQGQVMPSGNFKTLQGQAFSISYPDNWQTVGDQQSGGVTIAPPAGVTQGAVAYGVVINGYQPQNSQSLDQAVNELIGALQQSNPDLRAVGRPRDIRVNGIAGRSVDLSGTSPIQQNGRPARERDWLVALPQQDGTLMFMVFVAPEQEFNRFRPTYEQMLRSVRLR